MTITFLRASTWSLVAKRVEALGADVRPRPAPFRLKESMVMNSSEKRRRTAALVLGGLLLFSSLATTGCQVDIAGQTLPSGYYLTDDVNYYAPDAEFKLSREAAMLKERSAEQISEPQEQ